MKILRYNYKNLIKTGLLIDDNKIISIDNLNLESEEKLTSHDHYIIQNKLYNVEPIFLIELINKKIITGSEKYNNKNLIDLNNVELLSPIVKANSLRDAYSFRKHVEAGRKSRNLPMIKEFDEVPVYYYSNHTAITGPGELFFNQKHLNKLDFELELAIIIGEKGKNIKVKDADKYIFGFMIMNDWSARDIQKQEMALNLGPAKGKDFCTSLGPYIVTKDEIKKEKSNSGNIYDLEMLAFINDKKISQDNAKNMHWTFAQIISHISLGTTLHPGDVIGSGTCATGCLLELNLTNKTNTWLKINDVITLEIDKLGKLKNKINLEN